MMFDGIRRSRARGGCRVGALAILAALLVLPAAAHADHTAAPFDWSGRMATTGRLHVNGLNGDIDVRPGTGDRVTVHAVRHADRDDPSAVRIEVNPTPDGLAVCAIYPNMKHPVCDENASLDSRGNTDVKVDFTITLPAGADLRARNVNGGISAVGLAGDVKVETVNGGVHVATRGRADAASVNGGIDAEFGTAPADARLTFRTVNGGIVLHLPERADCDLSGSTVNGDIESDVPASVHGRWGPKRFQATLGRGGAKVVLNTVNGSIRVARASRSD